MIDLLLSNLGFAIFAQCLTLPLAKMGQNKDKINLVDQEGSHRPCHLEVTTFPRNNVKHLWSRQQKKVERDCIAYL
jgi:hypothetical protein